MEERGEREKERVKENERVCSESHTNIFNDFPRPYRNYKNRRDQERDRRGEIKRDFGDQLLEPCI